MGDEAGAASILGANFSAGFAAGSIAAAATCPLDVARTRRQIEVIPCPHSLSYFFLQCLLCALVPKILGFLVYPCNIKDVIFN